MADTGNVFTGGAVFKSKSSLTTIMIEIVIKPLQVGSYFVNHLSGSWSNDVRPQESVCGLLPKDLHQAIRVVVALGPAVGDEGELAHVILDALGLEVLLVLADPGHLLNRRIDQNEFNRPAPLAAIK